MNFYGVVRQLAHAVCLCISLKFCDLTPLVNMTTSHIVRRNALVLFRACKR